MKQKLITIILICIILPGYGQEIVSLDYRQFVEKVLQHSKDIAISKNEIKLALVEKQKAMAQLLPQAGAEGGYKRYLNPEYIFMEFPDFKQFEIDPETGDVYLPESWQKFKASLNNTFSVGAVLNQTLFSLKAFYDVATANEYQQLIEAKQQLILQEVLLESSKAFLGTLLLHQSYELDKRSLVDAKENLKSINAKYQNGLSSRFDYLQANVNCKNAEVEAQKSERLLRDAENNLKLLCNIPAKDSLILIPFNSNSLSNPISFNDAEPTNNLNHKLSLTHINMLSKELKSKKAAYYPTIKGQLGYTYYAINDDFKPNENVNSFGHAAITLSIPILSGGYNRAVVKESTLKLLNAEIEHDYLFKKINNDLLSCNNAIIEARLNIETATETEQLAKEAYELAKVNSTKGLLSQRELQEARLVYETSSLALAEAKYRYHCNILDHQKLNGTFLKNLKIQL